MSSERRGLNDWLSTWLPVLVCIAVICIESTAEFGSDYTSKPLRAFFESIFGPIGNAQWQNIHHLIRKCGHFFGYGLMGLAWLRAWWRTLPHSRFLHDACLALLGTTLVAGADEWHQSFLSDRTGTPWDVLLDCCGAIALQMAAYLYLRMFRPKRLIRE